MSEFAGKTIARVEEDVTDPEYRRQRDDTVLIVFTDGTALRVQGYSHEEVSQSVDQIDAAEVRAYQHAAQGRREAERLRRLRAQELAAQPREVREERERVRREKLSPFARVMEDMMRQTAKSMMLDMNRMAFGPAVEISPGQQKGRARRS